MTALAEELRPNWPDGLPPERAKDLMAVALELFARHDYSSVTIKDIARSLGVNTALIYYYFDSKEDLFRATLEYFIERALETFRGLERANEDPVKMLSAWFSTQTRLAGEIRQLVKIMLDYSISGGQSKVADAAIRVFYQHELKILSSRIQLGIKKGIFRAVNVKRATQLASTHLDGIMVGSLMHPDFDVASAIRDFEEVFWNYLGYSPARKVFLKRR